MGIVIIFFAVICDAWRDGWLGKEWWPRHIAKWLAFYPPLIYILWRDGLLVVKNIETIFIMAATCLFIWRVVYKNLTE